MTKYFKIVFLCILGLIQVAYAGEGDLCHVFIVQIPDTRPMEGSDLSETEKNLAIELAMRLASVDIAAIYTSDDPSAQQTAALIAAYHNVPITSHTTLQKLVPNTLFRRVGDLRTLGVNMVDENRGRNIVLVTHESVVRFIGRYVQGDFKKIPNFSYIEVSSDGTSMFLSILKIFLEGTTQIQNQVPLPSP